VAFTTTKGRLSVHVPGLASVGSDARGALFQLITFLATAAAATARVVLLRYGLSASASSEYSARWR
jgi:hypothetical protein